MIFLHGIWRHIKEFGIEGQIPRISSPVKLAPASKSFQDFINSVPSDPLSSFNHVTAEELKSIAKGFKDGKAPRADNIPISIIKKTLDLISDPHWDSPSMDI